MSTLSAYNRRFYSWIQYRLAGIGQWFAKLLEDTKHKNSIAVLDGVRAIAALLVVAFHISLITRDQHIWGPNDLSHRLFNSVMLAGASGVTLFFVLSGFLLFMPYAKSLLFDSPWPLARHFYLRRVFRIVPGYYASLFLMILLFHPEYLHRDHLQDLGLFLTFFMDSSRSTFRQLNGPFWTLAVEWQYYMILPLLASGIRFIVQRGSLRRRIWALTLCLLGVVAWGLFWRYWGIYLSNHPSKSFLVPRSVLNVIFIFTFGTDGKYLEDFAIGMLVSFCYIFAQNVASGNTFKAMMLRLSPWLWRVGIVVLLLMALWHYNQNGLHPWPIFDRLFPYFGWLDEISLATGFGLCVASILWGSAELKRLFAWTPLRWIGVISYSLYMWHLPLLVVFMHGIVDHLHGWNHALEYSLYWVYFSAVAIPFSLLFYLWIEKPWIQLGERIRRATEKKSGDIPPRG